MLKAPRTRNTASMMTATVEPLNMNMAISASTTSMIPMKIFVTAPYIPRSLASFARRERLLYRAAPMQETTSSAKSK